MSELGRTFFAGSSLFRWVLGPLALLAAFGFALIWTLSDRTTLGLLVIVGIDVVLLLLVLVAIAPERCWWAGRALAAIVFLAYVAYLVSTVMDSPEPRERSVGAGAFSALLGLLIIGYPSLKYALLGRFTWREPEPEADAATDDGDLQRLATPGSDEDGALAEQGVEEWAEELDREDRAPT